MKKQIHWTPELISECLDHCYNEDSGCHECPADTGTGELCQPSDSEETIRRRDPDKCEETDTDEYREAWYEQCIEDLCDPLYLDLCKVKELTDGEADKSPD